MLASKIEALPHYPFALPTLAFGYMDLEPMMDAKTVEIHYVKHHAGYVEKLNAALKGFPALHSWPIEDLLRDLSRIPEAIREVVKEQGGGHANHQFLWSILKPGSPSRCPPALAHAIEVSFGSFEAFRTEFGKAILRTFGSGWVFLVVDPMQAGKLRILSLPNHESILSLGLPGLLICDVWEHAYYLKHQDRRADYIESFWKLVDWNAAGERLENHVMRNA